MSLKSGASHMQSNYNELMANVVSPGRQKAIKTLMAKHNISYEEAVHKQALRIIQAKAAQK